MHEARRIVNDTIVVSYVDADGTARRDDRSSRRASTTPDVRTRAAHVEDWVALLVANHLFAGADAFVAAHLWDVPAPRLSSLPRVGRRRRLGASFKW